MNKLGPLVLLLILPISAQAVVYRCKINGEWTFTDEFAPGCQPMTVNAPQPNPNEVARELNEKKQQEKQAQDQAKEAARRAQAVAKEREERAAQQAKQQALAERRRRAQAEAEARKPIYWGPQDNLLKPSAPPGYRLPPAYSIPPGYRLPTESEYRKFPAQSD
jgi:hypothetical protein